MIYLTELANLTEGLYWARKLIGEEDLGRSQWIIVCVLGVPPFLDGYVIAYRPDKMSADVDEPWQMGYTRTEGRSKRFWASEWEFGPRIDIPSEMDRVEFAPRSAKERMIHEQT